jgi:hypothetical protein
MAQGPNVSSTAGELVLPTHRRQPRIEMTATNLT